MYLINLLRVVTVLSCFILLAVLEMTATLPLTYPFLGSILSKDGVLHSGFLLELKDKVVPNMGQTIGITISSSSMLNDMFFSLHLDLAVCHILRRKLNALNGSISGIIPHINTQSICSQE